MHEKICVIDQSIVFLGSTNLTSESLTMHDNILLGFYSHNLAEDLALHLKSLASGKALQKSIQTIIQNSMVSIDFFPNKYYTSTLLKEISQAKKSLRIAMFTFTHPDIITELIKAKKRGIHVEVAIDRYSYLGASKKALKRLKEEQVPMYISTGPGLFHHKWIFIDDEIFLCGSANWTRAAFNSNYDYIAKIFPLPSSARDQMNKLWKTIEKETSYEFF